jgi:hypothetical protein
MTLRKKAPRAKARWLTLAAIVGAFMLISGSLALAVTIAPLSGSTFEGNDGNLVVPAEPTDTAAPGDQVPGGGTTDWSNVTGLHTGIDLPSGKLDNAFGQGTKEDNSAVTIVTGAIPPNKNDLTRFYEASETVGANTFLYLAWERAVNIGNANMDFEINQVATPGFDNTTTGAITLTRTVGDVLVTYDFSGSGTPTLGYRIWSGTAWGAPTALNATNSEGAVNTAPVDDPISGVNSLGVGLFGEAAINLTAAGIIPPGTCESFGSTFLKSRSSSSFTAELKDFIAPVAVNINNCGTITIHKVTENGDASFPYTTTGGLSPSTFNLSNGGTQTYTSVAAGNSSVTETPLPTGWTLKSLVCTATGTGTSATTSGATASITMAGGGNVDCTYTNHINLQPTLTTKLSADSILNTGSVTDTATLAGATATDAQPITISVYSGSTSGACVPLNLVTSATATPVTLGNGDYTATFSNLAAGSYELQASITSDANNLAASSVCGTEPLTVQNAPSASTAQNLIPNDTFTLSGFAGTPSSTVHFYLFAPGVTCSVANEANAIQGLTNMSGTLSSGSAHTSNTTAVSTVGTYTWLVVWAGDTLNQGASSNCVETFNINNG